MTYQEKIVKYLRFKATMISAFGVKKTLFLTGKDEDAVLKWNNKVAEKVWKKLGREIKKHTYNGICQEYCPFCVKNKKCRDCEYIVQHKICQWEEGNHLAKVFEQIDPGSVISNKQYKFMWEKIDNEKS